jgi:hypothetical protein
MPDKQTAAWKLPYPTSAGETSNGATDIEELALKTDESLTVLRGDVVQLEPGANDTVCSWGYVAESGDVEAGSGDYTVSRIATGEYEILWNKEKESGKYGVTATTATTVTTFAVAPANSRAQRNFAIRTYTAESPKLVNAAFSFTVMARN